MKSTSTCTKLPFFAFFFSFFPNGKRVSQNKTTEIKSEEIHQEVIQPLDLYTQYRNLYLDPTTTIRSRAMSLGISRSTSERLLKKFRWKNHYYDQTKTWSKSYKLLFKNWFLGFFNLRGGVQSRMLLSHIQGCNKFWLPN